MKSTMSLSFSLAKAHFKVRNEGSLLGIFWYLLEPLAFFLILFFISGALSQNAIDKYPLYLFVGLIMFNFFSAVTTFSTRVMADNAGFIKSLKIRSEAFVISGVLQFVFSHVFELIVLVLFAYFFGMTIPWLIFYPIIFFFYSLFATGISLVLAVVGVYIGDLRNVWSVFSRLLWFATPIFYGVAKTSVIQQLNLWNPLYYFITIAREIVIYQKMPNLSLLFIASVSSVGVFGVGLFVFEKCKNRLAEKL